MREANSGGQLEKTTLTLVRKTKSASVKQLKRLRRDGLSRHSLSSLIDELLGSWLKKQEAA